MRCLALLASLLVACADDERKGTAPSVSVLTPNGGDIQIGSMTITWTADAPDVDDDGVPDELTLVLELVPYLAGVAGTPILINDNAANTGSFTWTIPDSVPAINDVNVPIPYRVRITATDNSVRSDESDLPFTIEKLVVTSFVWADVKDEFTSYCATSRCHDSSGVAKIPAFCAAQYAQGGDPVLCAPATDQGVYEHRSRVLTELANGRMPPPSANPQPTAAERALMVDWLRGGAPGP